MVERRGSDRASGGARMAAAVVLFLLTPFVALLFFGFLPGLVPLGGAVWLIATSPWSRRARIAVSVAFAGATIVLVVLFSQLTLGGSWS